LQFHFISIEKEAVMTFRKHSAILAAVIIFVSSAAHAEPGYPVIFTSQQDLDDFGIYVRDPDSGDEAAPRGIPCYDIGRRGIYAGEPIAVSDALLARYRAKGFTRETLCIALISQARYDPETKKRIPTYILRRDAWSLTELEANQATMADDPDVIPKAFANRQSFLEAIAKFKSGNTGGLPAYAKQILFKKNCCTNEQPLAVPACFKNGTPYLDCNWRFGLQKGASYPSENARKLRDLGVAIDRQMKDAIASGKPLTFNKSGDNAPYLEPLLWKEQLAGGLYEGQPANVRVPQALLDFDKSIAWFDISPELPHGYAYSLHGWALDDGAASLEAIELATGEERESGKLGKKKIAKDVEDYDSD
jgi:hypothetical protein